MAQRQQGLVQAQLRRGGDPGTTAAASTTSIAADWPIANTRWYAVDGVNGSDTNVGYSDVSLAAAGLVAKKTIAALGAIFPRLGNGRKAAIVIAAGTYADPLDSLLVDVGGYVDGPLIRGTVTDATAGSVAFANDSNECTMAGGVRIPGLHNNGYNPTAGATSTVIPCQLNGGGAAALPAEPASPLGYRLRFDSATPTAALRNATASITKVAGGTTLTLWSALPAVPGLTDVFYLEQPGVVVPDCVFTALPPTQDITDEVATQIVGIRCSGTMQVRGASMLAFSFCGTGNLIADSMQSDIRVNGLSTSIYIAMNGLFPSPGGGLRMEGSGTAPFSKRNHIRLYACVVASHGLFLLDPVEISIASATVIVGDLSVNGAHPSMENNNVSIGSSTGLGQPPVRFISGGKMILRSSRLALDGCDFQGVGANPAIKIIDICILSLTSAITGSTGNTDVGLDLTSAKASIIFLTSVPTVTGTLGDVRLANGTIISWATAAAGVVDTAGNQIFAAGNAPTHPTPVAAGAVAVTINNAPVGSPAAPTRYVKFPDGAGGFYTFPSLT